MKIEYYNWECLYNRPNGFIPIKKHIKVLFEKEPIKGRLAWLAYNVFTMFIWILYIATLPFALINEFVREW